MDIEAKGAYSHEDLEDYYKVLGKIKPKTLVFPITVYILFVILVLFTVPKEKMVSSLVIITAIFLSLSLLIFITHWLELYFVKRKAFKTTQSVIEYEFCDTKFSARIGEMSISVPWKDFSVELKNDERIIIKFTSAYYVIPKRFFSNLADWEDFNGLISKKSNN